MKKLLLILLLVMSFCAFGQSEYKTKSGVLYKVGDTIRLGEPLSHLGWQAIYKRKTRKTYMNNRNLVNKDFVIVEIVQEDNEPVIFKFEMYNTMFSVRIDEALDNKEVIPPLQRQLQSDTALEDKLKLLEYLKQLYDKGVLTKEEYESEKKKLLKS